MVTKYRFSSLRIEITRRCNKRCEHCAYGDAQNLSMSADIIDRIFEDVKDVKHIAFGNGESLLETEQISYFVDKLIESQWTTSVIEVTTNGILHDPAIIKAFAKYCAGGHYRTAEKRA